VQQMCGVLGVDHSFVPDVSTRWNVSGIPKNKFVHSSLSGNNPLTALLDRMPGGLWLRRKLRNANLQKPPFPESVRQSLCQSFRDDILRLQDLLKRDLSKWLV